VAVVNPTKTAQKLRLSFQGVRLPSAAKLYLLTGPDEMAHNVPGRPLAVTIEERAGAPFGGTLIVPPVSVSLYEIAVRTI
jgi:alpha-L-arabinofuranosidase